ncbi:MAG: S1C family serine protease [Granulosicoccus sp.]
MRVIFLAACVVIGILSGLWWSGLFPGIGTFINPTAAVNPATTALTTSAADSTTATAIAVPATEQRMPNLTSAPATLPRQGEQVFSYNDGIMRAAPAVVSIYASEPDTGNLSAQTSQGSGVIVDANGIVLTNLHIVENFELITVVLNDGRSYAATLIGSDTETDLAVVRINAAMLPFMRLDEAAPLKVGDVVLAIGNPFGVGQTVTQGIVSATRRRIANASVWQNFVQIDAAINPGNSGGALINPMGQLVGVNTAVFRGDAGAVGIGFAIPADLLAQVVPQIIEHGSISRGWLGLGAQDINMYPAVTALVEQGAVITAVQEGGPADLSGIRPMDIVVQLGEQPIHNATHLLLAVSALPPGATVRLALLRSPDPLALNATGNTKPLVPLAYKVRLGTRPAINQPSNR